MKERSENLTPSSCYMNLYRKNLFVHWCLHSGGFPTDGELGVPCRDGFTAPRGVEPSSHAQTWAQGERKSWLDADPDDPPGPGVAAKVH